jgi:hypothetical protein
MDLVATMFASQPIFNATRAVHALPLDHLHHLLRDTLWLVFYTLEGCFNIDFVCKNKNLASRVFQNTLCSCICKCKLWAVVYDSYESNKKSIESFKALLVKRRAYMGHQDQDGIYHQYLSYFFFKDDNRTDTILQQIFVRKVPLAGNSFSFFCNTKQL